MGIKVLVRDREPVEKALRRLKRLCKEEGVDQALKAKKFFEKPSERRRRKAKERMKVIRMANKLRSTGGA
jgi:small subunit ribosomal protein S21